jgi:hypothetical protein
LPQQRQEISIPAIMAAPQLSSAEDSCKVSYQ